MIILELIFGILEFIESWRLYIAIGLCITVIWLVSTLVTSEYARLAVCIPLGILGFSFGIYWQFRNRSS